MEDFAQLYGLYPKQKYQRVSYNNIVNMLSIVAGEATAQAFIQRLIFNILIGNSDLHLKNGSLLYPDTKTPQLAPAYDYVAIHVFIDDTHLALSISGEKDIRKINVPLQAIFGIKNNSTYMI
jgi:serine/threonine-protein kinase HipA